MGGPEGEPGTLLVVGDVMLSLGGDRSVFESPLAPETGTGGGLSCGPNMQTIRFLVTTHTRTHSFNLVLDVLMGITLMSLMRFKKGKERNSISLKDVQLFF